MSASEFDPASASTVVAADGTSVTVFSDGSILTVSPVRNIESKEADAKAAATSITRSKDVTYTNSDGETEWKYTLTASFSYEYGVSATCTNAAYSQTIYEGNWKFSNGSATHSGSTAYGDGTYVNKLLFITIRTIDIDISITCDIYGHTV